MAEALAVIGIIANIIALVNFSNDLLSRFADFSSDVKDVPKSLQDLETVLPLVADILRRTQARVEKNEVEESTCKAILPVLDGCKAKLTELNEIMNKVVPKEGASRMKIFWKSISSTFQDKKVEKIAAAIRDYVQTLTLHHAEAAEFSPSQKQAIATAMASMTVSDTANTDDSLGTKGLCLLSLDGGGVRGLSILFILADLMTKVNEARNPPLKPCELFDMIGGTGTGGLIAIMLGRLQMNIDEAIEAYTTAMETIVGADKQAEPDAPENGSSLLDQETLKRAIVELLQANNIQQTENFRDSATRRCRTFVCAADLSTGDIVLVRDYIQPGQRERNPMTIVDAACATFSSPTLFPPVIVKRRKYAGGELGGNNPMDQVWTEATEILAKGNDLDRLLKCIVSIGTGNPVVSSMDLDRLGLFTKTMAKIAAETDRSADAFVKRFPNLLEQTNKRYFRFNVDQGLQDAGWQEHLDFGLIEGRTEKYMDHPAHRNDVNLCATNLQLKQTQENPSSLNSGQESSYKIPLEVSREMSTSPLQIQMPQPQSQMLFSQQMHMMQQQMGYPMPMSTPEMPFLYGSPHIANYSAQGPFLFQQMQPMQARIPSIQPQLSLMPALASNSKAPKAVFMVPFERDEEFVGRTELIKGIERSFEMRRRVAVVGMGGIGKSQIAIETCYRFRDRHPDRHVFWVHASTQNRFTSGYQEIAEELNLSSDVSNSSDIRRIVKRWLDNKDNGEWLLIIDNADSYVDFIANDNQSADALPMADFLPKASSGTVLITTRDLQIGEGMSKTDIHSVGNLPMNDSNLLLNLKLRSTPAKEEANKLLKTLDHIPLAITQSASFIRTTGKSISDYIAAIEGSDQAIIDYLSQDMADDRKDSRSPRSVVKVFLQSFDLISTKNTQAAQLLSLMSTYERHGIPESLIRNSDVSQADFDLAIAHLESLSLIAKESNGSSYSMHRFVQLITKHRLELDNTLVLYQDDALKRISVVFPTFNFLADWSPATLFINHAEKAVGYVRSVETTAGATRILIMRKIALYYQYRGNSLRSHNISKQAIEEIGDFYSENVDAAEFWEILYYNLNSMERVEDGARALHKKFELRRKHHLDTEMYGDKNLAECMTIVHMSDNSQFQETEVLARKFLARHYLGHLDDRVRVAYVQLCLGYSMAMQKMIGNSTWYGVEQREEIEELLEKAWTGLQLGSPLIKCTLQRIISLSYYIIGNETKAEEFAQASLNTLIDHFGENHPETLRSMASLAQVLCTENSPDIDPDRLRRAEDIARRGIALSLSVQDLYGAVHFQLAVTMATILKKSGRFAEAKSLFYQAMAEKEQLSSICHMHTILFCSYMDAALYNMGFYDEEVAFLSKFAAKIIKASMHGQPPSHEGIRILKRMYSFPKSYLYSFVGIAQAALRARKRLGQTSDVEIAKEAEELYDTLDALSWIALSNVVLEEYEAQRLKGPLAICDSCNMYSFGTCHMCLECKSFDFCARCNRTKRITEHPPEHAFKPLFDHRYGPFKRYHALMKEKQFRHIQNDDPLVQEPPRFTVARHWHMKIAFSKSNCHHCMDVAISYTRPCIWEEEPPAMRRTRWDGHFVGMGWEGVGVGVAADGDTGVVGPASIEKSKRRRRRMSTGCQEMSIGDSEKWVPEKYHDLVAYPTLANFLQTR